MEKKVKIWQRAYYFCFIAFIGSALSLYWLSCNLTVVILCVTLVLFVVTGYMHHIAYPITFTEEQEDTENGNEKGYWEE